MYFEITSYSSTGRRTLLNIGKYPSKAHIAGNYANLGTDSNFN